MGKRIVTLTTDFGLKDPFVGIMRGVILGINPDATIVDLCHEVEPGNILRASYLLDSAVSFFNASSAGGGGALKVPRHTLSASACSFLSQQGSQRSIRA